MPDLRALQEKLGYSFSDEALLLTALTHPSYAAEHAGEKHYQRLEFLGDAVLELSVSRRLFQGMPDKAEGRLTRVRASIVREETLFQAAQTLGLGGFLRISVGEERTGGREKPGIVSDVFEAVLAAVYLDGGFDAADAIVDRLLGFFVRDAMRGDALDAKSRLQEMLQRQGIMPEYRQVSVEGPQHAPVYRYQALARESVLGEGEGRSKQAAQQQAAQNALDALRREKN